MTLAWPLHLLFLFCLVVTALCVWLAPRRAPWRRAVWTMLGTLAILAGWLTVNAAFAARGAQWLGAPQRSFRFQLRPSPQASLGHHHVLVAPLQAERLPFEWDGLLEPVQVHLKFQLHPSGNVSGVRMARSSGRPELDAATLSAIGNWQFGARPAAYPQQGAESVTVVIANRYALLSARHKAWPLLLVFLGIWLATFILLPALLVTGGGHKNRDLYNVERLVFLAGLLCGLGLLITLRLSVDLGRSDLAIKQGVLAVIGFAAMSLTALWARGAGFESFLMRKPQKFIIFGAGLLFLTGFTPLGTDSGSGHQLWLRSPLGPLQTVELTKILLIAFVAATAYGAAHAVSPVQNGADGRRAVCVRNWGERHAGIIGGFALTGLCLVMMRDFGPFLLLALLLMALLALMGQGRAALYGVSLLALFLALATLSGYPPRWQERVAIWDSPFQVRAADSERVRGGKEQMARNLWSIVNGRLLGAGFGQGAPSDIEAVESDFTFTVISEEWGWLGGAAVLLMLCLVVTDGLRIAMRREGAAETLLAGGISALFAGQIAFSIGGGLQLWPLTGVTIPLGLSYGGSSTLASLIAVGLLIGQAGRDGKFALCLPSAAQAAGRVANGRAVVFCAALFGLLACKAALLQWLPLGGGNALQHAVHRRADGTVLTNPRLDDYGFIAPAHVVRGALRDRFDDPIVQTTPRGRKIKEAAAFAPLVGMPGQQRGLEHYLDNALTGRAPQPLGLRLPRLHAALRGNDVTLAVNPRWQVLASQLLKSSNFRGTLVGIRPQSGEILFAVDNPAPTNDAEWVAALDNKVGAPPLFFRRLVAPGSVMKIVLAAAALEHGVVRPDEVFHCQGVYHPPGGGAIHDQHGAVHGRISLSRALELSCNCTFAQIGVRLGWEPYRDFVHDAGLDRAWSLLPLEARPPGAGYWMEVVPGQLTHRNQSPSQLADSESSLAALARASIGQQSVLVTPLWLASFTAAIANNGVIYPPSLVQSIADQRGTALYRLQPRGIQIMSPRTAKFLRSMMEGVVSQGTGRPARLPGLSLAGKTGTPEVGDSTNALFVGFAPVEGPHIAIAAVIQNQSGGGRIAGPLVAELARTICAEGETKAH